ncbi:MAG: hypothetical protein ACUVTU_05765 [Desulfurispora sp.]|uniref:hypothetical protein n=1 Tax=Desulfurispora sp. TaxID=3014275 RepID=UPI00404AC79E
MSGPVVNLEEYYPQALQCVNQLMDVQEIRHAFLSKELGNKQVRSLIDIASRASCLEELYAYILYKVGRDKNQHGWARAVPSDRAAGDGRTNVPLGERLIAATRHLLSKESMAGLTQKEKLMLLSRFFGYLYWRVTYEDFKGNNGAREQGNGQRNNSQQQARRGRNR